MPSVSMSTGGWGCAQIQSSRSRIVCRTYRARKGLTLRFPDLPTEKSQGAAITIHARSRRAPGRGRPRGPTPRTRRKPPRTPRVRAAQGRPPAARPRNGARQGATGADPRNPALVPPQGAPESGAREGGEELSRVCFSWERVWRSGRWLALATLLAESASLLGSTDAQHLVLFRPEKACQCHELRNRNVGQLTVAALLDDDG